MMKFKNIVATDYCNKVADGTHDSPKRQDKGKFLITSRHIKGRSIDFENAYLISEEDFNQINQRSKVDQWDILISMIGEYCGFSYVERNEIVDYAVKNVGIFKTGDKIKAEWLYYYLISPDGKNTLLTLRSGTSQPYIPLGALRALEIPVPEDETKMEQIVFTLSSLDDKIEINLQMNQTLEAMAQAIFKEWFVNFNFPGFDGEFLNGLPNGWKEVSLDDVIDLIIDHRGKTPIKLGGEWSDAGITALSAKNVKDGKLVNIKEVGYVNDDLYNKWMKEKLNPFDILLTSEAPLGELAILISNTKYCLSQRLFGIRANKYCKPTYLYSFLRSKIGKENVLKRATGSTVVGIRQSELRNVEILLPDNETQIAYDEVVRPLLIKIDENYNEINILTQIRDSLLPKLMTGKIEIQA